MLSTYFSINRFAIETDCVMFAIWYWKCVVYTQNVNYELENTGYGGSTLGYRVPRSSYLAGSMNSPSTGSKREECSKNRILYSNKIVSSHVISLTPHRLFSRLKLLLWNTKNTLCPIKTHAYGFRSRLSYVKVICDPTKWTINLPQIKLNSKKSGA